jgi:capsular exopolysaccharide synthesis family protein
MRWSRVNRNLDQAFCHRMEPGRARLQQLPVTPDLRPADPRRSAGSRTFALKQYRAGPQFRHEHSAWHRQVALVRRYKRLVVLLTAMGMATGVASTGFIPAVEVVYLQVIALAFLGCLGLFMLGAVLLDRNDRRVRSPDQVWDELGLTLLGTVPHVTGGDPQLGLQEDAEVGEAFRVIRRNLMHVHGKAEPAVVAVTSPSAEEGKSFVSAKLALEFSALGRRTLVIDADLSPAVPHRLNGGSRGLGLAQYLRGRATLEQVIRRTSNGNFDRIGCGAPSPGAPKRLRSSAMALLLGELRSLYDVILVKTSPLDAGADPVALATHTGNLVLVLRAGATDIEVAKAKLQMLDRLPINVLGGVLNGVPQNGVRKPYRRHTSGNEIWDREQLRTWQHAKRAEPAPVNDVRADLPRAGKVYHPNGGCGKKGAQPAEASEPVMRMRPVEMPVSLDTLTFDRALAGGNGGNGDENLAREYQRREDRREAQQSLSEAPQAQGQEQERPQTGDGTRNGGQHDELLEAYAATRLEKFREHQRRHHHRYWS